MFGSTPGASLSAEERFVASVAPITEAREAPFSLTTGGIVGSFIIQKEDTLGILEAIVEKRADFHQWGPFSDIEIMDWEGFVPDMQDKNYTDQLKARMNDRVDEIKAFATEKEGNDKQTGGDADDISSCRKIL